LPCVEKRFWERVKTSSPDAQVVIAENSEQLSDDHTRTQCHVADKL
jgi:hypothetical protein